FRTLFQKRSIASQIKANGDSGPRRRAPPPCTPMPLSHPCSAQRGSIGLSVKLFVQVPNIRVELPFPIDLFPNDYILASDLLWVVALSLKHCIALFASCVGAE